MCVLARAVSAGGLVSDRAEFFVPFQKPTVRCIKIHPRMPNNGECAVGRSVLVQLESKFSTN